MQNGYVERLNGRMRDELLNERVLFGLYHTCSAIAEWADDYYHFPAALVARIPDPGSLCRDHRRNRLQRCAIRKLCISAGCSNRAIWCIKNHRGSNRRRMKDRCQVTTSHAA